MIAARTRRRCSGTTVLLTLSLAANFAAFIVWSSGVTSSSGSVNNQVTRRDITWLEVLTPSPILRSSPYAAIRATEPAKFPATGAPPNQPEMKQVEEVKEMDLMTDFAAQSTDVPNLLTTDVRVMIAIVTGGKKNTTLSNRQAVVDTWFGPESYMVTAEDVSVPRVIRLPPEAERGGRPALPKKVKFMFAHLYEYYLDQYDWFVKLDDDTYVHMDRLKKTLSAFDPTLPILLGKAYSTNPSSGGVTGPGALWKDVTSLTFCHGGAGYAMSRELLRRVGPHLLKANTVTSLEDAAIAAACFEVTGVRCVNANVKMFGGIDLMRNAHDQNDVLAAVKKYERQSPATLVKTATVHSVQADMTRYLHAIYRRLDADVALTDKVDLAASADMERFRSSLSTSFNCTLASPAGPVEPQFVAVCQRSALRARARTAPREPAAVAKAWALDALGEGQGGEGMGTEKGQGHFRACQPAPPIKDIAWMAWDAQAVDALPSVSTRPTSRYPAVQSNSGILVAVGSATQIGPLRLFLRSLRATGSSAWVVVFAEERGVAGWLPHLRDTVAADCSSILVIWSAEGLRTVFDALGWKKHPGSRGQLYGVMASYLRALPGGGRHVLLADVETLFQRDPFKALPLRQGLCFFAADPLVMMPEEKCFNGNLRIMEKLSVPFRDTVFGSLQQVQLFLAVTFYRLPTVEGCTFDENLTVLLWRKTFAALYPVNVLDPVTSPVVSVTASRSRYRIHDGLALATNLAGIPAVMVVGYTAGTTSDTAGRLVVTHPAEFAPPLNTALAAHPADAASIRAVADFAPPLTKAQWPVGDKAFSRFQALGVGWVPEGAVGGESGFLPVWQLLTRHQQYTSDPARAVVTKMAVPKTHKTGSSTLASVFFRYAARHRLRMWQRGTWTFVPASTFVKAPPEEDRQQYDLHMSHLNPRGFFRGPFARVVSYYRHVVGPDVSMVTLVREPRQQYVSWLYYYVVPKYKDREPADILLEFVDAGKNKNILSQEFALREQTDLDDFMANHFGNFKLIMLAERFDESLVLLRRLFNWDLLDITYMRLLDSNTVEGSKRWDGKSVIPTPKIASLDPALVAHIAALVPLDIELYAASVRRFDEQVAAQGPGFADEVAAFKELQATLAESCRLNRRHAVCSWYQLTDLEFFRLISEQGYSPAVPML